MDNPNVLQPERRLTRDPNDSIWETWTGSVLGKDDIRRYATECAPPLIAPFEERLLKPASYHLRLGSCCRVMGEDRSLSRSDPVLRIPPFAVAIVSTLEQVNLPSFLIARWNLRVKRVYEGLIWTGSLQVDPGYSGQLFCPLFNLSDEPRELEYGEPIFTVDFVKVAKQDYLVSIDRPAQEAAGLAAVDKRRLQSGLGQIPAKIDNVQEQLNRSQGLLFIVLSVLVTAIAIIAGVGIFGRFDVAEWQGWASLVVSALALLVGSYSLYRTFFCSWAKPSKRKSNPPPGSTDH